MRIKESLNITFDESLLEPKSSPSVEDDRIIEPVVQNPIRSLSLEANASELGYPKSLKEARGHLIEQDEEHWMMVMRLWSNIAWIQENMYALRMEMREIHASINNDLKVFTAVIEDIAKVFLKYQNEE
nr:hypothetical protein [Tanacetum cinerariifolium]